MEWNIRTHAHACQISEEPFEDGDTYHTLLIYAGREGYVRKDVCDKVWREQFSQNTGEQEGYVSHWQGIYRTPPPPPPDPIKKENAESLLRKLVEMQDEKYLEATYILAVMLERKRVLKVRDQLVEDGQRTFVYEHMKSKEMFTIPDMNLKLDQLEAVQREVADLLEYGFDGPPKEQSDESATQETEASENDEEISDNVESETQVDEETDSSASEEDFKDPLEVSK